MFLQGISTGKPAQKLKRLAGRIGRRASEYRFYA
jgi:hypothetical protein